MISVLKQVKEYLIGNAGQNANGGLSHTLDRSKDGASIQNGCDASLHDESDEECREEFQSFSGKVTTLNEPDNYGIINDDIYFDFQVATGLKELKIGQSVSGQAVRYSKSDSWCAVAMLPSNECWEDDTGQLQLTNCEENKEGSLKLPTTEKQSVIAIISQLENGNIILSNTLQLSGLEYTADFTPMEGDWVTVKLLDMNLKKYKIAPLRIRKTEGRITKVFNDGSGIINNQVYFTKEVCAHGYLPRSGDPVELESIESKKKIFEWRALYVCFRQSEVKRKIVSPLSSNFTQKLLSDKEDILISSSLDFKEVAYGEMKYMTVWIRNMGLSSRILLNYKLQEGNCGSCWFEIGKIHPEENGSTNLNFPIIINPDEAVYFNLICHTRELGRNRQLLLFEFDGFTIGRHITVTVFHPSERLLAPKSEYHRKIVDRVKFSQFLSSHSNVIPGEKPFRPRNKFSRHLPQFTIPRDLLNCIVCANDVKKEYPVITEELCPENYGKKFHTLLYLEEIKMNMEMEEFNMTQVCLFPQGEYLTLEVPGLAENRPSLIVGDRVILLDPVEESSPEYEGYVHEIHKEKIFLKFHYSFHSKYAGESYNVKFFFNRAPIRRCHQAIHLADEMGENVLFPSKLKVTFPQVQFIEENSNEQSEKSSNMTSLNGNSATNPSEGTGDLVRKNNTAPVEKQNKCSKMQSGFCCPVVSAARTISSSSSCPIVNINDESNSAVHLYSPKSSQICHKWFNVKLNKWQKVAVKRILSGQCRPTPYIIFGPPGTGKTVTVVEGILQLFKLMPSSRILACTPSNSAADLIVERLLENNVLDEGDLVRLNAFQRGPEAIPESIRFCCKTGDDMELVIRHRIVVCTCVTSGNLYNLGLNTDHFSHVIIDEAGQATEPEAMIAISLAANAGGQVILAGDPMQLGPVLHSHYSKKCGLQTSFLERLMSLPLYKRDDKRFADHGNYDPVLVTKLINSYRSHSAIISLPSKLFYNNELIPSAPVDIQEMFKHWITLPNPKFPIIFHGIKGEEFREENNPSWFNPAEIVQTVKYLQDLYEIGIAAKDVGIITPYRKQVEKLRFMIDCVGAEMCKVGSVEEFQGQERIAIIISTVRTCDELLEFDAIHNLGFLTNPKRFNVAITRAQALLVIVGDPFLLCHDGYWRQLLSYCLSNNAYIGCDFDSQLCDS